MARRHVWMSVAGVVLVFLIVLTGYLLTTGRSHSSDINQLRARFNQDKGKARLLMLLSPT